MLNDNGILAIVVPTYERERLVHGHVTSWSISLLCYNLIMAGFDCSGAVVLDSYELSLIVKKLKADYYLPDLINDGKLSDLEMACKNYNSESPYNPKLFELKLLLLHSLLKRIKEIRGRLNEESCYSSI